MGDDMDLGLAAFENHLAFIAAHRGGLSRDEKGITIESRAAGFSSWIPLLDDASVPPSCKAVRLAPWNGSNWRERLQGEGFAPGETLAYMSLPAAGFPHSTSITVERAEGAEGARRFAEVQMAGFATGDAEVDRWWSAFFIEMATRNIGDDRQSFYLAPQDGEAAACALVVRAAGVAGLYAVATRPQQRGRGLAAALLARAARDSGSGSIILQAMKGSYAEGYYARLGFVGLHELTVWRRP